MPSVKRRASTRTAALPAKKARIVEEPESVLASRPKRKAVAEEAALPEPSDPKRRGRPPKDSTAQPSAAKDAAAPPKPRGRPRLNTASGKSAPKSSAATKVVKDASTGKKRGRPSKTEASVVQNTAAKKQKKAITSTKDNQALPKRRPGRPSNSSTALAALATADPNETATDDGGGDEANDEGHAGYQYWLMKAEPNDRYENGVNVKFSIDDLAAASVPEPWDGVRNFAARNNMRAMRKNDLAFFYHSNCQVPGIVGVMRVVQEHTTDQTAFDPNHPYYDSKSSPSSPKWDCVHVEFVKKFDMPITLKMMQEDKAKSGQLANMQLLKLGRLSVNAVTPQEWRHILNMASEDVRLGEIETEVPNPDGYESDTDGEVDEGPSEELNGEAEHGAVDITAAEAGGAEESQQGVGAVEIVEDTA